MVLASLDLFIVNVALPDMGADLGAGGLGDLSWVLNGYAIVYASLLVLFGRLADRHRRERGFLLGVAVFTAASAACGLATSVTMLVAFRLVQAAGAALLTPTSLGLVLATAAPERRASSVRAWTAVGGTGGRARAGRRRPARGGELALGLPRQRPDRARCARRGLAAAARGARPSRRAARRRRRAARDRGGRRAHAGAGQGRRVGLGLGARRPPCWRSAAAALAVFVAHCLRHPNPLVDPALFRVRAFTGASVVALVFSVAFGAMLLSVVLWEQEVWGWSALRTGLADRAGAADGAALLASWSPGRLIARFGPGPVIGAGSTLFAAGIAWWSLAAGLQPDYVRDMLGGMLLTGVGVGLTLPTLMATAASSLPPQAFATGSGVVNMLRQVGLAVGVALLVALLGTPGSPAASLDAFRLGWGVTAAIALAGGVLGAALLAARRPAGEPAGEPSTQPA